VDPLALLALAALAAAAGYLLTCAVWPFTACPRCRGTGKARSPFAGTTWRSCRACRGTGTRLRVGRRMLNRWTTVHRRGTR